MRLLHVTDILPRPSYQCDPWYLERGKAVHLACHYLDTVGLDWSQLDPRIEGYVRAWEKCKRDTGAKIHGSEITVGGPRFGFVGTCDKTLTIGRASEIWDLKCGPPEPWHGLQLAAYKAGLGTTVPAGSKRRTVHLRDDGTYSLVEHAGRDDYRTFLAYLAVAYWEINHGLREWPALREGEE